MTVTRTQLSYTDVGNGTPALVHLSGWCGGREVFAPLLARATRRCVAIDLPGHGQSPTPAGDFTSEDVIRDVIAAVDALGLEKIVPVTLSHAGWQAISLRRELGAYRVPGVVLLDWMPLGAPPGFLDALAALQNEQSWEAVRVQLFDMWRSGVTNTAVQDYIASMGEYGYDMWSRAGREIARSFVEQGSPVAAIAKLAAEQGQACPTLHLYAQPSDDSYLGAQRAFAAENPWFAVHRLDATSHFPTFEAADQITGYIDAFMAKMP
jgi:pimeloyl-ACP methyl ester carboxylesterase